MKQVTVVLIVLIVLSVQLTGGFVFASTEDEAPLPDDLENVNNEDLPIIEGLLETVNELMETIREYMAQVQQIFLDLIPDEEEEPALLPEDEVPTAGTVEGQVVDNDRNPLPGMQVVLGPQETTTDRNGFFFFENVDFGSHEFYLFDPDTQEELFLTNINIDEDTPQYSVSLVLSLPEAEEAVEEVEVAPVPVGEPGPAQILLLIVGIIILATVVLMLLYIKRKHIKIIDAKTGKTIEKQKIKIYPRTNVDLTEAFEHASSDVVRVQFLNPVVKKLLGSRVLFVKDGQLISEIENYTGELEVPITLPETPLKERADSETEDGQPESLSPGEDADNENNPES